MPDQTDNTTAAHDNNTSRAATLNNTHRSHLRNIHHLHSCYATQRNFHTRLAYVFNVPDLTKLSNRARTNKYPYCPTEMDHAKIRVTRIFAARPYKLAYRRQALRFSYIILSVVHRSIRDGCFCRQRWNEHPRAFRTWPS